MSRSLLLIKSRFFEIGGAEKYARALAEKFAQNGWNVTVLTTGKKVKAPENISVVYFPVYAKTSVLKLLEFDHKVRDYLRFHNFDVVFGCDRNCFQTHIRAGSGVHKSYLSSRGLYEPKLLHYRHALNPLHRATLKLEKESFEHPELQTIITNSHLVKGQILDNYRVDPKQIEVIHNGVQWDDFQESFDAWETNYDASTFDLLFLGSNFKRKGLTPLLKALSLLNNPNVSLHVVGKDKNTASFIKLTEKLNIASQVTFYGEQKTILPFFQQADALVLPSYYDPFANVTVEALAMGVYVLSSASNGGSEVLTKENGYTFGTIDPEVICQSLKEAIKHPKTKPRALAIRNSVAHLNFTTQLDHYLHVCS